MSRMMTIREVDHLSTKAGVAVDQFTDCFQRCTQAKQKMETHNQRQRGIDSQPRHTIEGAKGLHLSTQQAYQSRSSTHLTQSAHSKHNTSDTS